MDVDPSPLIYDDFSSLMNTDCNLDDLDEIIAKTETINYLNEYQNYENFNSAFYDSYIPIGSVKKECESPIDFNPDDFLNYLPPDTDKILYGERNTPSPTNSSTSSLSSESNSVTSTVSSTIQNQQPTNIILDTPPISPGSIFAAPINQCSTSSMLLSPPVPLIQSNQVKVLQGTIIPISTFPMTVGLPINGKPPPPPPPPQKEEPPKVMNEIKPKQKTIMLSAKDFQNLMARYKNQNSTGITAIPKIVIKQKQSGSSIPVLPKIAPQQFNLLTNQMHSIPKLLPKNMSTISSIIDEKTLKKQQRMIKNRKSACLSRMKKKDYVSSLENKIMVLEKENTDLKAENNSLRSSIDALPLQCQCTRNRKFSDINSISNTSAKNNNNNKFNLNKIMMGSQLRKNTAVLLAMVFMVSINVGTINNYLKPELSTNSVNNFNIPSAKHFPGRGLLWVDNNDNSTIPNIENSDNLIHNHNNKNKSMYPICSMSINNQTENLRLASELRKWIGINDYLNLSTISSVGPHKYPTDYGNINRNTQYRSLYKDIHNLDAYMKKNKKKTYFNRSSLRRRKKSSIKIQQTTTNNNNNNNNLKLDNPIEIYQPKVHDKYTKLFEEIRRRDDTFYVVSFNMEHILLPASAYNKSSRPKMSVMLPASDTLRNGQITLMQIDCEVINTTLVQLKEELIPKNLRPTNQQNTNKFHSNNNNNNNNNNESTRMSDQNTTKPFQQTPKTEQKLNTNNFNNLTSATTVSSSSPTLLSRRHVDDVNVLTDDIHKKKQRNHKPYFINDSFQRIDDVKRSAGDGDGDGSNITNQNIHKNNQFLP